MKSWKVQKFFGDLIYDMRSRGLLPLAALLLVAMVAIPMYLSSQGTDPAPQPPPPPADTAALAPENQPAVVAYEPGVRDYKKRLSEQSEKDPFIQQFTIPDESSSIGSSSSTSGGGASPDGTEIPSGGSGGTSEPGGSVGGSPGGTVTRQRFFYFETDIAIGEAGSPLKRSNRVPETTALPSEDVPVVLYLGTANRGKLAMFSVSRDVVSVAGEGACDPSPQSCQLLALEKGQSVDLTYSFANTVYTLRVADIRFRVAKKPPRALRDKN